VVLVSPDGELVVTGTVRPAPGTELRLVEEPPREISLDGERLLLSADREIVLRCGKSSITLTRDGKVVVRGSDLLQISSGTTRLKGAAVEIN
jgi:hypothetical protein